MLRKPPVRTPALLAANRRNALKSTGPRTLCGRARVALNALKHGRYAQRLGHRLLRAGDTERAALYRDIRSAIFRFMVPCNFAQYRQGERMAAEVWCHLFKMKTAVEQSRNVLWIQGAIHCGWVKPSVIPVPSQPVTLTGLGGCTEEWTSDRGRRAPG